MITRHVTKFRNTEHTAKVAVQTEKHIGFRIKKKWRFELAVGTLQKK